MSGILLAASPTSPVILGDGPYNSADVALDPANAFASLRFDTDGAVEDQDLSSKGLWVEPADFASGDYEIRATADPDTPDSGTMNTWLALSTVRVWSNSQNSPGATASTFKVEIRFNGSIIAEASCTITATVTT